MNVVEQMRKLNETEKTTFVFSTHDAHIMNEAKRIVRIQDGSVVDAGARVGG